MMFLEIVVDQFVFLCSFYKQQGHVFFLACSFHLFPVVFPLSCSSGKRSEQTPAAAKIKQTKTCSLYLFKLNNNKIYDKKQPS